jgi:hypothetical protein
MTNRFFISLAFIVGAVFALFGKQNFIAGSLGIVSMGLSWSILREYRGEKQ